MGGMGSQNVETANLNSDYIALESQLKATRDQLILNGNGAVYSTVYQVFFEAAYRTCNGGVQPIGGYPDMIFNQTTDAICAVIGPMFQHAALHYFHISSPNPLTIRVTAPPHVVSPHIISAFFQQLSESVKP
mmetsp:Transcript_46705/g.73131  ORF Transcript_46705/g.73131 Transcript_46705/m.73131 type:complete len:132 (+) Transcript_46705:253-648(+)